MCSYTHVLLNRVWMIEAEHPLTDDNCLQLDTAGLEEKKSDEKLIVSSILKGTVKGGSSAYMSASINQKNHAMQMRQTKIQDHLHLIPTAAAQPQKPVS